MNTKSKIFFQTMRGVVRKGTVAVLCTLLVGLCWQADAQTPNKIWVVPKVSSALPISNTITGNAELSKLLNDYHIEKYSFLAVNLGFGEDKWVYEMRLSDAYLHWGNSFITRLEDLNRSLNLFEYIDIPSNHIYFTYLDSSILPCSPTRSCNKQLNAVLDKYNVSSYKQPYSDSKNGYLLSIIELVSSGSNHAGLYKDLVSLNHLLKDVFFDWHYNFPVVPLNYDTVPNQGNCDPISTFPWTEDFEEYGAKQPPCWIQSRYSGWDGQMWCIVHNTTVPPPMAHSGNHKAFISLLCPHESMHKQNLISPVFDLSEVDTPVLSFWYATLSAGSLMIEYKNSAGQHSGTYLGIYQNSTMELERVSIPLPNKSSHYQIVFVGMHGGGYGEIHLDNITISDGEPKDLAVPPYRTDKFFVYPNPTTNQLRIKNYELRNRALSVVEVYNVAGQVVFTSAVSALSPETTIDISHLANGMYFLKIDNKVVKIIKN